MKRRGPHNLSFNSAIAETSTLERKQPLGVNGIIKGLLRDVVKKGGLLSRTKCDVGRGSDVLDFLPLPAELFAVGINPESLQVAFH